MDKKRNNKCICHRTDENFTEGKVYECTGAYVYSNRAMVDVLNDDRELVGVSLNDPDFEFILLNHFNPVDAKNMPYIKGRYNPEYGDNRICVCGHPYYRHFDSYDNMEPVGCKYCGCYQFEEKTSEDTEE